MKSLLPPHLFCGDKADSTDCEVIVYAKLKIHQKDFYCNEDVIPQVVFGVVSRTNDSATNFKPCGFYITTKNWWSVLSIPVVGTIDGLRDRKQKRMVTITISVNKATKVERTAEIGTVKVSITYSFEYIIVKSTLNQGF